MDHRKPSSNTGTNQHIPRRTRIKTRISGYLSGKPKRISATRVDPVKERQQKALWWLKWVIILPICAYALVWLAIIFIDLFKY
jgi:hypothetical protein